MESHQQGAGSSAEHVKREIISSAERIGEDAKQKVVQPVKAAAEQQKGRGASQISGIARAIHSAADELSGQMPDTAGHIHAAAEGVERLSKTVRERSIEDLLQEVNDLARKQPLAFFAASVLAGIAASRFLKSSSPETKSPAPHEKREFSS